MSSLPPSSPHPEPRDRALVLGGGGSAGNAWEIGIVAGLLAGGVDVTRADLIIGTSAGATVAAQITAADPAELLDAILRAPLRHSGGGRAATGPIVDHMERTGRIIASAVDAGDMRRRMGAAALELEPTGDESGTRWRETVAARLPDPRWPERRILLTAIDARTGDPVVFDRHSGVELVDAVAASTSNGFGVPPYALGDSRLLDGGYRRNENADLAAGHRRVLVLSPFGGRSRHPPEWGLDLATQVAELRAAGSSVHTVFPDAASLSAFGGNMMDLSARPAAARAGAAQGRRLVEELSGFWT